MSKSATLSFSHLELAVRELDAMTAFYRDVLGFVVTDAGGSGTGRMVFLSRDPDEHHQLVLNAGRQDAAGPSVLDHLSFRMENLAGLRKLAARLAAAGVEELQPANHGISWSLYFRDPEGNRLECFVDTPWHLPQPYREPLDLRRGDAEIRAHTEALCRRSPGFMTRGRWRAAMAKRLEKAER
jgi:catechol-2,3-dioxygenase